MTNLLSLILLLLFFLDKGSRPYVPQGLMPKTNNSIAKAPFGPIFESPQQLLYIKNKFKSFIGQYIVVTVAASIGDIGGFSGFLLKIGEDYIEVLCFPYHQDYRGNYWAPYVASIPINKITSVTHSPSRGY